MESRTLGAKLKEARRQAGLTQKDAADALGVTYQAISNYERDKCRVQAGILKQLCVLYHISATELLGGSSWNEGQSSVYDGAATDAEKLSLFDLWGVPEDRREEYEGLRRRMGLDTAAPRPEDGLNRREAALLRMFRLVPEESQDLVLEMIEVALKNQLPRKQGGSAT